MNSHNQPRPSVLSLHDERVSMLIHALGIALSGAGLVLLIVAAAALDHVRALLAVVVFGSALVLMYSASTLYHAVRGVDAKRRLRRLDHVAIYLLIAGTYTPFTLLALRGAWGWSLFAAIWVLAGLGSVLEFSGWGQRRWLAALVYVGMGWIGVFAFAPLHAVLASGGFALLLAGGVAYTLGVPFYLWRRLPFHHSIWHVFVLAGSVLQFLAVLLYLLPQAR
ncbi:MAG: hemolysin III family protein [Pseudomonadota bacterium]|jgi:hemolysin III|nr:hemolysin III family protein [Pseudomonadota bacterium]MDE3140782.1 hemolysin III family protein [Pseudomonadota bacterium]